MTENRSGRLDYSQRQVLPTRYNRPRSQQVRALSVGKQKTVYAIGPQVQLLEVTP